MFDTMDTEGLCNIGYMSESHPKLKSREISFGRNLSVTQLLRHFEQGPKLC